MPRVPLTEKTDRLVGSTVSAPLYGGVGRDVAAATTVVAVGAGAEGLFVGTGWELGVGLVGMVGMVVVVVVGCVCVFVVWF